MAEDTRFITIDNVSKSFKETRALREITFDISRGTLFGLIGPDGAGKTTLFRIITTLMIPDIGKATVKGLDTVRDFRSIRKFVGYMPGRFSLYQDLSVEENLNFYATIFGTTVEENYHLIKNVYDQLAPFKKRLARNLSGGMKQKLALSCALIHNPEILVLDEPTTGVDAVSRKEFWESLNELKKSGMTILVSTPYMDEAGMCDKVGLMMNGSILEVDEPGKIIARFTDPLLAIRSDQMNRLIADLRSFPQSRSVYLFGQDVHFTPDSDKIKEENIRAFLQEKGHKAIHIEKIKPTIEDRFMAVVRENFEMEDQIP